MIDPILTIILLIFVGLGIGIFISTSSGTSATILIPVLTIGLGYSPSYSIGTTLAIDTIIAITAAVFYLRYQQINVKSITVLVTFGILGSILGSQYTSEAPESILKVIIGIFLIIIGYNFARRGVQQSFGNLQHKIHIKVLRKNKNFSLLILGLIVGTISGFVGIGGGRMITIILLFILGYHFHQAVGTSLVIMIFIAGTGAISHGLQAEILFHILAILIIPVIVGTILGSNYANKINEEKLSRVAGFIILLFGMIIFISSVV